MRSGNGIKKYLGKFHFLIDDSAILFAVINIALLTIFIVKNKLFWKEALTGFPLVALFLGELFFSYFAFLILRRSGDGFKFIVGRFYHSKNIVNAVDLVYYYSAVSFLVFTYSAKFQFENFLDLDTAIFVYQNFLSLVWHLIGFSKGLTAAAFFVLLALPGLLFFLMFRLQKRFGAVYSKPTALVWSGILVFSGYSYLSGKYSLPTVSDKGPFKYSQSELFHNSRWKNWGPVQHIIEEFSYENKDRLLSKLEFPKNIGELKQDPIQTAEEYVLQLQKEKIRKHNVIIVLAESLRPDQLESFGGRHGVMPNVDGLAKDSIRFSRAYAQASHSDYADPCPFSSQYPLRSRRNQAYQANAYPRIMIYNVFKSMGYKTAVISSQNELWGGMKIFLDNGAIDWFFHSESLPEKSVYPEGDLAFIGWLKKYGLRAGKLDDKDTINTAIDWINKIKQEPFFAYINLQASHSPYIIPNDHIRKFSKEKPDFPILFGSFPKDKISEVKNIYAESLYYMDLQLGRLFDHLKAQGLWDNTVVVVLGDNGTAFYEHGFADHASDVFDEAVRTPVVMKVPGQKPRNYDGLFQHIDIAPTVLGLLGYPRYSAFQGEDIFSNTNPKKSVYLVSQTARKEQYAIVHQNFKLMFSPKDRQILLFDLEKDPFERNNIAESNLELRDLLSQKLKFWMEAQLDYYNNPIRMKSEFAPKFIEY